MTVAAANRRLHFVVFEASDMPRLVNFIRILWAAVEPYRSMYLVDSKVRRKVNAEYKAIFAAMQSRNFDELLELTRVHRDNALVRLRELLTTEIPTDDHMADSP